MFARPGVALAIDDDDRRMADEITNWYYGDDNFKKFRGYRLSAIDASILEINNSERLRSAFGFAEGGTSVRLARAKASGIYDLENDMMLTSIIGEYTTGERELAIELIEKLKCCQASPSIPLDSLRDLHLESQQQPTTQVSFIQTNTPGEQETTSRQ